MKALWSKTAAFGSKLTVTLAISLIAFVSAWQFSSPAASAQTLQVIHTFTGADGQGPVSGLTVDRGGRIYGSVFGGTNNRGAVLKMASSGAGWLLSPLHQFLPPYTNGFSPDSKLVYGPDGNFYSTTGGGGDMQEGNCVSDDQGCGVVYKLQPPPRVCGSISCPWNETVLYTFTGHPDGDTPSSEVIFDAAGNLYGVTAYGGTGDCGGIEPNYGCGAVYKLSHSGGGWTESIIYSFQGGNDGQMPQSGLVFDAAGNLYGVAAGASTGDGIVYELSPSSNGWTKTTLHTFQGADGKNPAGTLLADPAGNLYGVTVIGGAKGFGSVFELSQPGTWNFQSLYSFTGTSSGRYPTGGLSRDSAGNLYNTTSGGGANGYGVIFKLTNPSGSWTETNLHDFTETEAIYPGGQLLIDASGNIYGTAEEGGIVSDCYPNLGCGTIWEFIP